MRYLPLLVLLFAIPLYAQTAIFTRDLKVGDRGPDVTSLQIFLNSDMYTRIVASGPGSPGEETDYFGPLTRLSVIRLQELHKTEILTPAGLLKGTGYVGKLTRTFLNQQVTPEQAVKPPMTNVSSTGLTVDTPIPYILPGPTMLYIKNFDIYTATSGTSVVATAMRPLTSKSVSAIVHLDTVATSSAKVSGDKISFVVPVVPVGTYQVTFETADFSTSNPVTFTINN